jgi:hypothetical protein
MRSVIIAFMVINDKKCGIGSLGSDSLGGGGEYGGKTIADAYLPSN